MIKKVSEEFFGLEPEKSSDLCRIISDRHYQRLVNLIKTTKGDIVKEGKCIADERFVDLHVIANVSLEDPVMQEELFGPILPIVTVESVKEAIDVIKSRPKPLSMYIFTENKGKMKELIEVSECHISVGFTLKIRTIYNTVFKKTKARSLFLYFLHTFRKY